MRRIEDGLWRIVDVPERPERIVSLVPSVTELLFDLGAGDRVVGRSRYCVEPEAARGVTVVGGQKDPDLDVIAALAPDLVIGVKEENLARDVERLAARGVAVYVAEVLTVEDGLAFIGEIGDLVDAHPVVVERLGAAARAGVSSARGRAPRRRVRVFCPVWRDPWIAIGEDTYMSDVLRICGGIPVPSSPHDRRYPKIKLDVVRAARPDVILLPDEPYAFGPADADELRTIAPVHPIDGKLMCWYGRRTGEIGRVADLLAVASGTGLPAGVC